MSFKKLIISALLLSSFSTLSALEEKSLMVLNKIMDNGVIVNKNIKTNDDRVDLIIYKGLIDANAAYALLKITNNKPNSLDVSSVVKDGTPIKETLQKGESTYIVVEEQKMQNSYDLSNQAKGKQNNVGTLLKNSKYAELSKKVGNVFNIYFINDKEELVLIPKHKLKEYFAAVNSFDYYKYMDLDIQKGLYRGVFANGYETLKNGKIVPKTYYFIIDNLSGDMAYIYVVNKKINYNKLQKIVKGK